MRQHSLINNIIFGKLILFYYREYYRKERNAGQATPNVQRECYCYGSAVGGE